MDNLSDRKYIVYIHISPSEKKYIGVTSQNPIRRWNNGHGYKTNPHFWNAIQKYNWDNFEHIIYKENLSQEEASLLEKTLIEENKTYLYEYGYNQDLGGIKNKEVSDETKKKLSENHADFSGSNHPFYGKTSYRRNKREAKTV